MLQRVLHPGKGNVKALALGMAIGLQAAFALAQPAGVAWLGEGKVFLVRGSTLHTIADGVRVLEGDIIHTGPKAQVQLQFNGGTIANIGPATRVMVVTGGASPELALAAGWLKIAQKAGTKNLRVWTNSAQLAFDEATAVLQAAPEGLKVFVENGSLTATEPGEKPGAAAAVRRVRVGEFYSLGARGRSVLPRPGKEFLDAMPKHYRDPLPPLPERLKDRRVEPRTEREVAYDDVADWLRTPMPVRKGFLRRFMPRVSDPSFRTALAAHVREHMEWDRILFPEKYAPKEAPAPAEKASPEGKPRQTSGGKP